MKKIIFVLFIFLNVGSISAQSDNYDTIELYTNKNFGERYTNINPYFSILIPNGIELYEAINQNGIIVYDGGNNYSRFQIRIIDTYSLMNLRSQGIARRQYAYNLYSRDTMRSAYEGLIQSTLSSLPNRNKTNINHSIKKLGNNTFVFLKFDYIDDNNNPATRISYDFLINGYTVTIVGYVQKGYSDQTILNYLNSFSY